ncbi:MAG: cupin domain-containing protein [Thermoanaerobaculales bacterium]
MEDRLVLENRHSGEIVRLLRVRHADGATSLRIDGSLPPHSSGPPPHIHWREHEEGTVRTGSLGFRCKGETSVVPAGGSAVFPAGAVHAWWNAGEDLLQFSGRLVPAVDLDRFLQGIFAVLNAGPAGRPPLFFMAHVLWRHRRTQALASPPVAVQRMIVPLVVLLGHTLGKYRGEAWPGSPASCTGAPESVEEARPSLQRAAS